jgi:hypothetical protein
MNNNMGKLKFLKVLIFIFIFYVSLAKIKVFQKGFIGEIFSEVSQGTEEKEAPLPSPSQPPASQPPASQPPASQPPASQPPASQPPQQSLVCSDLIRNPDASLKIGDSVVFTCSHQLENVTFNHYDYRFKIDSGQWQNPSDWQGLIDNTPSYTISQEGTYTVQCRVCSSSDSSHCTTWGQAGGWTP